MDGGEEQDGGIDVGITDFADLAAVNPTQQRVPALAVTAEHARHSSDVIALHETKRAHFGRKPIACIVLTRRIQLKRKFAPTAVYTPDSAITAAGRKTADFDSS